MFEVSTTVTVNPVLKVLTNISKQVPFATALALTRTAKAAEAETKRQSQTAFDRPKTWTVSAWVALPASKAKPMAKLLLKDRMSRGTPPAILLRHHYLPGSKRRASRAFEFVLQRRGYMRADEVAVMPRQPASVARPDQYGNLTRAALQKMLQSLETKQPVSGWSYFVPAEGSALARGVWVRRKKAIQPVVLFVDSQAYEQRLDVHGIAKEAMKTRFQAELKAQLDQALRTAK